MGVAEEIARQRAGIEEALRAAGLRSRFAEVEPRLRHSIRIQIEPSAGTRSRLGGLPELPLHAPWPHAEGEPLAFVGQIALDEIASLDVEQQLPTDGSLAFFAGDPLDGHSVPTPCAHVMHVPASTDAQELQPPQGPTWWARRTPKRQPLDFSPLVMLPESAALPAVGDLEYRDFHDAFYEHGDAYPIHNMLGFDRGHGAVGAHETLLLRLDEDPALPYSFDWCESVVIYFIIETVALQARDFSAVRLYLGSTL